VAERLTAVELMEKRPVVALVGGGDVGGGWEEWWRRWWRCKWRLFSFLLSCLLCFSP